MGWTIFVFALAAASALQGQDDYVVRSPITARGLAPRMRAKELGPATRTFKVMFGRGDEAAAGLTEFAEENRLSEAHLTAIGAFDSAVLGWFDPEKRAYKKIVINQEVEVVSLIGDITMQNGKPFVHAHCVVAFPDGTTKAGHLIEGHVSLELEVYVVDSGEAVK
jgi:predicted DNA-binding protein with PD1-like motif